jgi:UTP--glucose-1-phosphate uridylyltransferase
MAEVRLSDAERKAQAMKKSMQKALKNLSDTCSSEFVAMKDQFQSELDGFYDLFEAYVDTQNQQVQWEKVVLPGEDLIVPYTRLDDFDERESKDILSKVVVLKLNGGLGTTMGCLGPKSAIEVRGDRTFLDLAVQQIEHLNSSYGSNVELTLMNSFNTHEDTLKIVQKYETHPITVNLFNQSRYPRFYKESRLPCPKKFNDDKVSYPPSCHFCNLLLVL